MNEMLRRIRESAARVSASPRWTLFVLMEAGREEVGGKGLEPLTLSV
jgi:hypothetical protein